MECKIDYLQRMTLNCRKCHNSKLSKVLKIVRFTKNPKIYFIQICIPYIKKNIIFKKFVIEFKKKHATYDICDSFMDETIDI